MDCGLLVDIGLIAPGNKLKKFKRKRLRNMTIYKSKSGQTALKLNDEITSIFGSCYRLDSNQWHHVGDTEPFDPSVAPEVLEGMFNEIVEKLDKQEFDLSRSLSELDEEELQ
jgi:hypothetical protein